MKCVSCLASLPLLVLLLWPSSSFSPNLRSSHKHDGPMAHGDSHGSLRSLLTGEGPHGGLPREKDTPVSVEPGTEKEESPDDKLGEIDEGPDNDTIKDEGENGTQDTDGTEGEKAENPDSNSTEDTNEEQDTPSSKGDSDLVNGDQEGGKDTRENGIEDPSQKQRPTVEGFGDSTPRTSSQTTEKDYLGPIVGIITGSVVLIIGASVIIFVYRRKIGQDEVANVSKPVEGMPARERSSSGSTQGLPASGNGSFEEDPGEEASVLSYIKSLSAAKAAICGNDDAGTASGASSPVEALSQVEDEDYIIPTYELDGADEMSLDFSLRSQIGFASTVGGAASVSGVAADYSSQNAC